MLLSPAFFQLLQVGSIKSLFFLFGFLLNDVSFDFCLIMKNLSVKESSLRIRSDQIRSVAQSCPTICDPINRSTPGLPVHHQLPEFTQTHVHRVSDAIQPSHPLASPSPPAPSPSQHQSLSNESTLRMRWPKYWSFSFSIIPSKEIPISF